MPPGFEKQTAWRRAMPITPRSAGIDGRCAIPTISARSEFARSTIDIGETSVSEYMVRRRNPPSQTWRTFLENRVKTTVSIDFFTMPTIRFQVLYVFLVLAHD